MLRRANNCHQLKTLMVLAIAISLASCSAGPESTNNSTDSNAPSTSSASSPSPQTTNSPASVDIPGVKNIQEINFKAAPGSANGFFNGTPDGSNKVQLEVPRVTPFNVSGWAILSNEKRIADMVLITSGDKNSLVAVAQVNLARPDVAKNLKNPVYENSGWSTVIAPSTLADDRVVLKGWAYNSATKEAIQLNNSLEVVLE